MGDQIYERDIKARVEADHQGEFVSIDVESGSWAISEDLLTTAKRLREQSPDAIDVCPADRTSGVASLWGTAVAETRVTEGVVNSTYEAVVPVSLQSPAGQTGR